MILCNNNDQTWFSDTLTSNLLDLGFQRHPRGPADVNTLKNMFDS